jgi:hypothetical protein
MRVAVVLAAVALAGTASAARTPAVALVRPSPAVVAGTGYAPHTRVAVVYRSGGTSVRRVVVSSRAGTFRLTLRGVGFSRCDGLSLRAGAAAISAKPCAVPGGRPTVSADPGGLVAGTAFVPGERVAVSGRRGSDEASASAVAGAGGSFQVRLRLAAAACTATDVRAVGSLGSTASGSTAAPDCSSP